MKLLYRSLFLIMTISMVACASSRSAEENLSEEGILQSFNDEDSGNKIIYTDSEKPEGNYDVKTSLDYNEKTSTILYTSLADRLRKIGGLTVSGTGNNVSVLVRGMSSIKFSNQPIYVIDGLNVGDNYARANGAIDVNQIKTIKVLKGPAQTARYGEVGKNGVILITTFSGANHNK